MVAIQTRLFQSRSGQRYFQIEYSNNGRRPRVSERIIDMAFNELGVRDTSRVLKISKKTVTRRLKKLAPAQSQFNPLPHFSTVSFPPQIPVYATTPLYV